MSELGNRPLSSIVEFNMNTAVNGVPTDMAGSPAASVYKSGTNVETTAGITLTAPYDSTTGLVNISINTGADAFYVADKDYSVVITTGTLGGISMVGYVVGSFRLSTEDTNINKSANAMARGTATTGGSTTSIPTSSLTIAGVAATGVVADQFKGRVVLFDGDTTTAGLRGTAAAISANTASNTPTLTVGTLPATPASGDTFSII